MKISPGSKRRRLRTRVVRKIEGVPAHEWNTIFPNVPEGYYFLKTLDESNFDEFTFYYILVYEKKKLVGAAPCFLVNYSLDTSINGPLRRFTNAVTKIAPHLFSLKVLVCGIPMGQGQIGAAENSVVEAIHQRMEMLARKTRALFLAFKDFDRSYDDVFAGLLKKGFLKIDSLPMTRLKLDFESFDDYLKGLSANSRYDFRRKIKKIAGLPLQPSVVTTLDEATLEEVYGLYLQVVRSHEEGFEIVPKEFFRRISINMPQETKFFLLRMDGKLLAFTFCLAQGGLLLDYYLGFDYSKAHAYRLFFNKFPYILDWCLKNKMNTYEMGQTGYDGKRRLGFDFVPVYLYVKARHRWLRPFLKILCAVLKFENFEPEVKKWQKKQRSTRYR